jgi:hypothetical protein
MLILLGARYVIIVENRNIAMNTRRITTKNINIVVEQHNIWNHNTKIILLLIGNNVHLLLRGGNLLRRKYILK